MEFINVMKEFMRIKLYFLLKSNNLFLKQQSEMEMCNSFCLINMQTL
jgi:hypothetical protein